MKRLRRFTISKQIQFSNKEMGDLRNGSDIDEETLIGRARKFTEKI